MHFGENQLSPHSISFSLLSAPHPGLFQQAVVRSSNRCYPVFNLDTDRSYGFGSIVSDLTPSSDSLSLQLRTLKFLTSPHTITRRLIFQEARCHIRRCSICLLARGFRSVSLPPGGAFHLSLSVLLLCRSLNVFSLGPWAALIRTEFHVLRTTRVSSGRHFVFAYGAFTLCGAIFQLASADNMLFYSLKRPQSFPDDPSTPGPQRLRA